MMTPPQPAPLLPPMLLLALILVLLLLAPLPLTDSIAEPMKERGSRSTGPATAGALASLASLGNASAAGRDFRSTTTASHGNAPPPTATSVYTSDDIDGDLIGGRERDSFMSDDLMWNNTGERDTRMWEDQRMKTSRNDKSFADSFGGGPQKALRLRNRRQTADKLWIKGDLVDAEDEVVKMHVLVVKDEDIPDCGHVANKYTRKRYYMCSGAILNANRVLTSATCVNRVQIHKFNVQAEIGVLIGAIAEESYVIKVNRIVMHPDYVPDPNSPNHALNNIAMLMLACPIPRRLLAIPKLPFELYTDVGHMCCPDRCKILTVVEDITLNYHFLKFLPTKHLPRPLHNYIIGGVTGTTPKSSSNSTNEIRSTPPPQKKKKNQLRTRTQVREKRETRKRLPARHFAKNAVKKLNIRNDKEKVDVKESEISFRDSDMTDVKKPNKDDKVDDKDSKTTTNEKNAPNNNETTDNKNSNSPKNDETADNKNSKSSTNEKNASDNDDKVDDKNSKSSTNEKDVSKNDETADNKNSKSSTNDKNAPDNDETTDDKNPKSSTNEKNASNNDGTVDDKNSKPSTNEKNSPNNDKTADNKNSKSSTNETGDDKDKSTVNEKRIDWEKIYSELSEKTVTEESKKHILKLTQDAISDTLEELTDAMTEHAVNLNNTFPYFEKILKDNLDNYMSNDSVALTKKIKKNIGSILLNYGFQKLKNSSQIALLTGSSVNDTDLLAYSNCSSIVSVRRNIDCPPLGSPVIVDNILVGLIVYTCDDLQTWVEWKYLDLIKNLDWIHRYY